MTVIALPLKTPPPGTEPIVLRSVPDPGVTVVESEALWKDWDDAVQKQDLRFGGGQ